MNALLAMPFRSIKFVLRALGVEAMSRRTWDEYERKLSLFKHVARIPIDVFSLVVDLEFDSKQPFFVQVGANDGLNGDKLFQYVTERCWRGILVEPQPDVFERLQANHARCPDLIFENVAVARKQGSLKLYRFQTPPGGRRRDTLTTCDRNRLLRARDRFGVDSSIEEIDVPVATIDGLLVKHGATSVDVLMVDTEGMDFEVLQTVDFSRFAPRLIQFEHIHLTRNDLRDCVELLRSHRYRLAIVQRDVVAYRS